MEKNQKNDVIYREIQKVPRSVLSVVFIFMMFLAFVIFTSIEFVEKEPDVDFSFNPNYLVIFIAIACAALIVHAFLQFHIEIRKNSITIKNYGLTLKTETITIDNLQKCQIVDMLKYRWKEKLILFPWKRDPKIIKFTDFDNKGIELVYNTGRKVVISTRKPEEMLQVIMSVKEELRIE